MASPKQKTVAELEAERRALGEQIKAARRAEAKRQRERESAAEQALGRWLIREWVGVDGADTLALADALRVGLDSAEVREFVAKRVRQQLAPDTSQVPEQPAHAGEPQARSEEGGYDGH